MTHGLGRRIPVDMRHAEKYPLRRAATIETAERTLKLPHAYRSKMDQGEEGACVGFALSWAMCILNRQFYDSWWLWDRAKEIDDWPDTNPGDQNGTSVRAGCDVLRDQGHRLLHRHRHEHHPELLHGIQRNEWTTTVDGIRSCIAGGVPVVMGTNWYQGMDRRHLERRGRDWWMSETNLGRVRGGHAWCVYAVSDRRQACRMVNSWGKDYPLTWVPYGLLERLLTEDGEATILQDRIAE